MKSQDKSYEVNEIRTRKAVKVPEVAQYYKQPKAEHLLDQSTT